jgi:hypothetical protein
MEKPFRPGDGVSGDGNQEVEGGREEEGRAMRIQHELPVQSPELAKLCARETAADILDQSLSSVSVKGRESGGHFAQL